MFRCSAVMKLVLMSFENRAMCALFCMLSCFCSIPVYTISRAHTFSISFLSCRFTSTFTASAVAKNGIKCDTFKGQMGFLCWIVCSRRHFYRGMQSFVLFLSVLLWSFWLFMMSIVMKWYRYAFVYVCCYVLCSILWAACLRGQKTQGIGLNVCMLNVC